MRDLTGSDRRDCNPRGIEVSCLAMSKWEEMVQVEVYVKGKGPLHRLKVPLEGYERKQIDLEAIMAKCRLQNVYAYSITAGRGIQQFYNPKNGLSKVSYSGKPDSIIRLDGDPKVCGHSC